MATDEIRLVCEGVPGGRDMRWLNLALSQLAQSFDPAARVRVVPAGGKADLLATVRGMQRALKSNDMFAIRDRDFLPAHLLGKDEPLVHSLRRHCIESYLLEPNVLEEALGIVGVEQKLLALAEAQFWPDVTSAVLDAIGFELRKERLGVGKELPMDEASAMTLVQSKLDSFRNGIASKAFDIKALITAFAADMRSEPLWMRVDGKELLKTFAASLDSTILPGGDIEAALHRWCGANAPPSALMNEVHAILVHVMGQAHTTL